MTINELWCFAVGFSIAMGAAIFGFAWAMDRKRGPIPKADFGTVQWPVAHDPAVVVERRQ